MSDSDLIETEPRRTIKGKDIPSPLQQDQEDDKLPLLSLEDVMSSFQQLIVRETEESVENIAIDDEKTSKAKDNDQKKGKRKEKEKTTKAKNNKRKKGRSQNAANTKEDLKKEKKIADSQDDAGQTSVVSTKVSDQKKEDAKLNDINQKKEKKAANSKLADQKKKIRNDKDGSQEKEIGKGWNFGAYKRFIL